MSLFNTSVCLSGLFFTVAVVSSFVTVAPGHEQAFAIEEVLLLSGACAFGALAVLLRTLWKAHRIRQSRRLAWTYAAFAMVLSLALLFASVG